MIISIVLLTALASIDAAAIAAYRGLSKNKVPEDLTKEYLRPEIEYERQKIERQKTQAKANQCGSYCNLESQHIKVIQGVTWPEQARSLNLVNNPIKSLDGVIFSDNLTVVNLSGNKGITSFANTHFPIDLKVLQLDRMELSYQTLSTVDWKSFRKLTSLSIGRNQITFDESFGVMPFPQSLDTLVMDWLTLKSLIESGHSMNLPNLKYLWLTRKSKVTAVEKQVIETYFENDHLILAPNF